MNKQHLEHETIDRKTYWFAPTACANPPDRPKGPTAHLLSNYDEYLIAYRDRSAFFDPSRLRGEPAFFSEALRRHIIVIDGQVVGGWHSTASRDAGTVHATLLVQLNNRQQSALSEAAAAYGRFLGRSAGLKANG
jgi:hypothetical protein